MMPSFHAEPRKPQVIWRAALPSPPVTPATPAFQPQLGRSVTIDQAAALLGVSRRTVYYRIREGRLLTVRTIGGSQRVLVASLDALSRDETLDLMAYLLSEGDANHPAFRR